MPKNVQKIRFGIPGYYRTEASVFSKFGSVVHCHQPDPRHEGMSWTSIDLDNVLATQFFAPLSMKIESFPLVKPTTEAVFQASLFTIIGHPFSAIRINSSMERHKCGSKKGEKIKEN